MPIEVKLDGSRWSINKNGLCLGSVCKKKIYYRDTMIANVQHYMQQLWDYNIVEKMKTIEHDPPKDRDLEKMLKDERWFHSITIRNVESHKHRSLPVYEHPKWPLIDGRADFASTGATPLNMYKAIKDFMKTPEVKEKIYQIEICNKFGV